ncbi:hypothetical protein BAUCODRAFT_39496 [Baudoinia panamericana UAMH 10762]|uniref:ATPase AAA-type core domain-containing protein n=1 Tax=Baudoinia panamericana (strain UAMH 10762) TaxID=717646 RepID=M2MXE2_BAUPA|nr:uncharacterized protein BAUCODRAFT_39496 [Baudoinia panamericana UAMH 10762]EMC91329.1 hypothetical protein BAUCODRAFT_39496 [Baudoinia panamericana UAMH 10762]
MDDFVLLEKSGSSEKHQLFHDVHRLTAAGTADHDLQYLAALRKANPGMIVTAIPINNIPLRAFAAAGFASCELDTETDSFASRRGFQGPIRRQIHGHLAESVQFAKYHLKWASEDFIFYLVDQVQYVVKERRDEERALGPSRVTDALIQAAGDWLLSDQEVVWVYDLFWTRSKPLYDQVMKASWDKVILDEKMKKELTAAANKFFSAEQTYKDLGVPWKRGLLFHGPPGNGKTISIKALMHTLLDRDDPIPTLYVRNAPRTFDIHNVFMQARALSPCMLILEDVETIVTPLTRSYFFNEMDGLENNDGILIVASTNFLDRLDPGLSKRPSRFDRKYLFPQPNEHERTLYCEFWHRKLQDNPLVDFPEALVAPMAHITAGFSFAFLQECFVTSLLTLARDEDEDDEHSRFSDDLEKYELWRIFKQQAETLRKQIESEIEDPSFKSLDENGVMPEATSLKSESKETLPSGAGAGNDTLLHPPPPSSADELWKDMEAELAAIVPTLTFGSSSRQPYTLTDMPEQTGTALPDLNHLHPTNEVLPELAWQYRKRRYINSAAYMYGPPG